MGGVNSVCYVSAFLDIGRDKWTSIYKRTVDEYMKGFFPFIKLFNESEKDIMLLFMDDKYIDAVQALIDENGGTRRIIIIPINYQWMENNSVMWSKIDKEREIMTSDSFIKRIPQFRLENCPETFSPEYNMINHAKLDFINYAIEECFGIDYFSWVDFGLFNSAYVPANLPNINKYNLDRINYNIISNITESDSNEYNNLVIAPERIAGHTFFGSRRMLFKYRDAYIDMLNHYHNNLKIVDDDQAVAMSVFFKYNELFHFHPNPTWKMALKNFE